MKDTRDCYNLLVGLLPSTTENSRTRFLDYMHIKCLSHQAKETGQGNTPMQKPQDMTSGMNKRPPKWGITVWILGISISIAQTLHAYQFSHNNLIGVLLGIMLTIVWIIWAIQVWHQEIAEPWLRIRGKNHEAN